MICLSWPFATIGLAYCKAIWEYSGGSKEETLKHDPCYAEKS